MNAALHCCSLVRWGKSSMAHITSHIERFSQNEPGIGQHSNIKLMDFSQCFFLQLFNEKRKSLNGDGHTWENAELCFTGNKKSHLWIKCFHFDYISVFQLYLLSFCFSTEIFLFFVPLHGVSYQNQWTKGLIFPFELCNVWLRLKFISFILYSIQCC